MFRLENSLQNYAWGSPNALTELYGITDPQQRPMAELWMGAHPKSPSFIDTNGTKHSLREWIAADVTTRLGSAVAERFGELPFLFKVLSAAHPLSIQVHPSKSAAVAGFQQENQAGIPLDAPQRNYKDANHKPELVYALTPFQAINGFRATAECVALLTPLADVHQVIADYLSSPDEPHLRQMFTTLISLEGEVKSRSIRTLLDLCKEKPGEPWRTIEAIAVDYPDDGGLFTPLLLNVVTLQPGEAMFLYAETPHAYLHGVALEVMANSDNVLRAGLTPKHIDVPELLANVRFQPSPANTLLTQPIRQDHRVQYAIPVDDFAFSIETLQSEPQPLPVPSATIVFCIEGEAQLTSGSERLILQAGESGFIPADSPQILVHGRGRLARVYNELR
ncbi:mannose-6-phosphate isomerase [Candidatus Pantoea multigeneris]|uniref:mannose-6-phosphate isomerase n=1 Tax=Candidatus Pantoea multigeneris TaxID=2608357 RepID=A0ABX0RE00_9GAMM|nr:mannose-6-phosphate isomerase [Pantoea multigeneris]NIF23581.1 mannose-6-phosphate isomerase [Pantoea multigeneris]